MVYIPSKYKIPTINQNIFRIAAFAASFIHRLMFIEYKAFSNNYKINLIEEPISILLIVFFLIDHF